MAARTDLLGVAAGTLEPRKMDLRGSASRECCGDRGAVQCGGSASVSASVSSAGATSTVRGLLWTGSRAAMLASSASDRLGSWEVDSRDSSVRLPILTVAMLPTGAQPALVLPAADISSESCSEERQHCKRVLLTSAGPQRTPARPLQGLQATTSSFLPDCWCV